MIITGGTKTGVMKFTAKAMRNYELANGAASSTVILGIATWGSLPEKVKRKLDEAITNDVSETIDMNNTMMVTIPIMQYAGSLRRNLRTNCCQRWRWFQPCRL